MPTDPSLALRWLVRARRAFLALQIFLTVLAEAGELHLHHPGLVAVLVAWLAVDLLEALWLSRRELPRWGLVAHAAVDVAALTGILALAGGHRNPLLSAYLAYLAVLAMVLPARQAWVATGLAMLLQALVVFFSLDVPGLPPEPHTPGHLVGTALTFDVPAVMITWVVTRLSASLREARAERETTARLAALGTLGAGVAHELGTPLGTIALLTDEIRRKGPSADVLETLRAAVDRCRAILDRLRGRDSPSAAWSVPDVPRWVEEWCRARPDVPVKVDVSGVTPEVRGAGESWRAALWVVLDNAARAGASRVSVTVAPIDGALDVRVRDDGCGLSAEEAERAGEPFRTGWNGTGLGLFVARTFARSVGGDVRLHAAEPGATAVLRMARR